MAKEDLDTIIEKQTARARKAMDHMEAADPNSITTAFSAAGNVMTMMSAVNDATIAAAIHDAKEDKKHGVNDTVDGLKKVGTMLGKLGGEAVDLTGLTEDYSKLKKAVYDTHVLGVGKNNIEKMETVAKGVGRVATGLLASAFSLAGAALTMAGNLVKLAPIAGFVLDRLPGLSYTTKKDVVKQTPHGPMSDTVTKHHNLIEGAGAAFQKASEQLQKFAYPVQSEKVEFVKKLQGDPQNRGRSSSY